MQSQDVLTYSATNSQAGDWIIPPMREEDARAGPGFFFSIFSWWVSRSKDISMKTLASPWSLPATNSHPSEHQPHILPPSQIFVNVLTLYPYIIDQKQMKKDMYKVLKETSQYIHRRKTFSKPFSLGLCNAAQNLIYWSPFTKLSLFQKLCLPHSSAGN